MCSLVTKDEADSLLARLRHLICEIEEIIDDVEKLKGDTNGNVGKGFMDGSRERTKGD